jgi:hypothetical protein
MEQKRTTLRVRTVLKAEIRYNDGLIRMPCIVRDISDGGARIELPSEVAIPEHVDLYLEKKKQIRCATIKAMRGRELHVAFNDTPAQQTEPSIAERLKRLEADVAELRALVTDRMPPDTH